MPRRCTDARVCSPLVDRHLKHQSGTSCKRPRCWRRTAWIPIPARFPTRSRSRSTDVISPFGLLSGVKVNVFCLFRTCPGTRPSSPSRRLDSWCSKETKESIFSNGEPGSGVGPRRQQGDAPMQLEQLSACGPSFIFCFVFFRAAWCTAADFTVAVTEA